MKNDFHELTLDEKLHLLTGKDCWNIHDIKKLDSFSMADGPNGLRKEDFINGNKIEIKSVAFPCCHMLANSWSKDIVKIVASCMADDCIENKIDMLLAPAINIKRDPRCGRNFEYFSEDPLLAGTLAKEYIDGLQESGIGTSLKHYCCNNEEDNRQTCNIVVDKRTLMEIYTRNFYYAIKGNPTTIMCAYNKINGSWCSENKEINDILYNKLNFKGAIISDWGAVHNKVNSVKAGLALQMPYSDRAYKDAKEGFEKGILNQQEIDNCTFKTVELIKRMQEMKKFRKVKRSITERHEIARIAEEEGIVLLKNNGILPLKKESLIGITGYFDKKMYSGGGSGNTKCDRDPTMLADSIETFAGKNKVLTFDQILIPAPNGNVYFNWRHPQELADAFKNVDCLIIEVGTWDDIETEGSDRKDIKLAPTTEAYIRFIGDYFKGKTVVKLTAGSAIDVSSWIDHVDALLYSGFGGEYVNEAVTNVLYGVVNPSGKLCETFPKKLEDISCFNTYDEYMTTNTYSDGIYIGYRHYEKNKINPMYEFGFGLSYTKFQYSNLKVLEENDQLIISYDIKNIGKYDGKEVSQIYFSAPGKIIDRPIKELCGYSKDLIKKGETKNINVRINKEHLCYFDVKQNNFVLEKGLYLIKVGSSSKDIRLETKIEL